MRVAFRPAGHSLCDFLRTRAFLRPAALGALGVFLLLAAPRASRGDAPVLLSPAESAWLGRTLLGSAEVAAGAAVVLGLVLLWNRSLHRSVRQRTEELRAELTERRRIEEAARRSEERLRSFFDAAGEGLFFHDHGTIVDVNLASSRIFGYAPEEIVGHTILEFVAPEDQSAVAARMAAGDEGPYEVQVLRKDGSAVAAEARARTIEREGGTLRVVAVQDISARKRVESALTTSQAELEARNASLEAIRNIADSLYGSLDLETVRMRAVDALMRHTRSPSVAIFAVSAEGTHADLTAAKGFDEAVLRAAARLPLRGSLTGIAVASGDVAVSEDLALDGRIEPKTQQALVAHGFRSAVSIPLAAEDRLLGAMNLLYRESRSPSPREREELLLIGKTVGLALANARHVAELRQEMRERERAEAEVRQARDELESKVAERTGELARANERLKELDRLKSMFIASMSHELRTPLNSIIGFTGVVLQGMSGELTARQRDQLQRVYSAAKHLLALITDVIDISKIEAGRVDVYPTVFELGPLVQEAVDAVRPLLEEKSLGLTVSVPEGLRLHTDRKRLLQCVLNYLGNAAKYTEAGSVAVECREIGDDVEISVNDTGIGVPPEALRKLFQPFERVDTHLRVKTPGTGLGLYLTRKLATELLGGAVSAESQPGKGSTFRLRIPCDLALHGAQTGGAS